MAKASIRRRGVQKCLSRRAALGLNSSLESSSFATFVTRTLVNGSGYRWCQKLACSNSGDQPREQRSRSPVAEPGLKIAFKSGDIEVCVGTQCMQRLFDRFVLVE